MIPCNKQVFCHKITTVMEIFLYRKCALEGNTLDLDQHNFYSVSKFPRFSLKCFLRVYAEKLHHILSILGAMSIKNWLNLLALLIFKLVLLALSAFYIQSDVFPFFWIDNWFIDVNYKDYVQLTTHQWIQTTPYVCNERIFGGLLFAFKEIFLKNSLPRFLALTFTLLLAPFESKLFNN